MQTFFLSGVLIFCRTVPDNPANLIGDNLQQKMEKGKKFIIPALALATVLGVGAYGVSQVSAQGGNGFGPNGLIERIAEKFNLNKDEVQKVFDENREQNQKQMQSNFEERLSAAVSEGKLTEEQKKLILEKRAEWGKEREVNREAHKSLSFEERKKNMEERKAEIENWAKENGIDTQYLMGGKMGVGSGHKGSCQQGGFCSNRK